MPLSTGISLPEKDALTISVYDSRYNDSGFYAPTSFAKEVSPASGTPVRVGDVLTYTIKVEFPRGGCNQVLYYRYHPRWYHVCARLH